MIYYIQNKIFPICVGHSIQYMGTNFKKTLTLEAIKTLNDRKRLYS